jgi:hypothetical protein
MVSYIVFTTLFHGEYRWFLLVFLSLAITMDLLVFGGRCWCFVWWIAHSLIRSTFIVYIRFFFVSVGLMPTVLTAKYGGLQCTLHDKLWYKFDPHSEAEVLNFQQFCNYFYRWYIPMWCLLALMLVTYIYVVVKLRREVHWIYILHS